MVWHNQVKPVLAEFLRFFQCPRAFFARIVPLGLSAAQCLKNAVRERPSEHHLLVGTSPGSRPARTIMDSEA